MKRAVFAAACLFLLQGDAVAQDGNAFRVLATSRTWTMQKEMLAAGDAGFRFAAVMGGETAVGGKEVVVATTKTSTLERELREAGEGSWEVVGMTLGETSIGGTELVAIARRRVK